MKFPYLRETYGSDSELRGARRPVVKVRLSFGDRHQAVFALIDSGADITLFHLSLAKTLGIDSFLREGQVAGISGPPMPVYFQKLTLLLDGAAEPVEVEAGFADSPGIGALLGQSGFFEQFQICFERSKEEIEIRRNR